MGHKAVIHKPAVKSKPKAPAAPAKAVHYKGAKIHGLKSKLTAGKMGAYAFPIGKTVQFHEAPGGVAYAVEPETPEIVAEEKESELASKLVDEIAGETNDVNELCERYGLRREELGRLTGFSLRALAEWASGKLPSQPAKRRLHEIRRLLDALVEIVKRESILQWLHKSNEAFDRLTPLQVIELGEMDRLWAMVHDLASGQAD